MKQAYSYYIFGSRALKCENNLQEIMSNVIFGSCIKIQFGHHTDIPYYYPLVFSALIHGHTTSSFAEYLE